MRSVAVVPFGARGGPAGAGAWGRQLARRLVDRFAGHPDLELKPVYLVALPEAGTEPGYLVLGSTPDPALAAQYGASLGTTHALVGVLADGGSVEATLVAVAGTAPVATLRHRSGADGLAGAEAALATWLASALAVAPPDGAPLTASASAYAALLEGLDEEVNATLLAQSDAAGALHARAAAAAAFVRAIGADAALALAEERLLVLAAESLERGDEAALVPALEALTAAVPRSWRAHYLLGELRRATGDQSGAVVALEHADALQPLSDADSVRLAELHLAAGADATARARLARIRPGSPAYAQAQDTLGVIAAQRGDLAGARAALERAVASGTRDGAIFARLAQVQAAQGDRGAAEATFAAARAADPSWELALAEATLLHGSGAPDRAVARYREAAALGAPLEARLGLARALVAAGDAPGALRELDALVAGLPPGELAGHARRLRSGLRDRALELRLEAAGQAAVAGPDSGLDEAAAALEAVLAAEPDLWEAHFASGLIARRRDDLAAAERAFARVLALWPDQPDALHELGVALLGAGRTNEALPLLDRAMRLRPDDPGYVADAGFAELRAGHLAAARQRLDRAARLDPDDPVTRAYRDELGRIEAAVAAPGERAT